MINSWYNKYREVVETIQQDIEPGRIGRQSSTGNILPYCPTAKTYVYPNLVAVTQHSDRGQPPPQP